MSNSKRSKTTGTAKPRRVVPKNPPEKAPESPSTGSASAPDTGALMPEAEPMGPPTNERDIVFEAVYLEARERGMSDRDASSTADDVCDRLRYTQMPGDHSSPDTLSGLVDLRHLQDYVYPGGRRKVKTVDRRGLVPVMRSPADVDSIVIHQTACEYGVSKRAIASFGSVEEARSRRALDVACHVMAFRNGYHVAAHDLRVYVNHANRLNSRSLGLEIEGRYPGLMDKPGTMAREDLLTTWGGKPTELTDKTVDTACKALKWLVDEAKIYGMDIKYIYAHRQSSDNRRSDPGQEIWQRVVIDYAVRELGLKTQTETLWTQGRSIPKEWDPEGKGSY